MAGEHSPRKALLDRALRLFQQGYEHQMSGELDEAAALYEASIGLFPTAEAHTFLAWTYSFEGRLDDAIGSYRSAYRVRPNFGDAFWSLANLKTVKFTAEDLAAMRHALEAEGLSDDDRLHLHYALGKAHEDAEAWDASFAHYAAGAAIRREQLEYDPEENTADTVRTKAVFSPAFSSLSKPGRTVN